MKIVDRLCRPGTDWTLAGIVLICAGTLLSQESPEPSPLHAFRDWQEAHFGSAAAPEAAWSADPDRDGMTNAEEFVFSKHPMNHDEMVAGALAVASEDRIDFTLCPRSEPGATLTVLTSTDLLEWTTVATRPFFLDTWHSHDPEVRIERSGDDITVRIPRVEGAVQFVRLDIQWNGHDPVDTDGDGFPDPLEYEVSRIEEWRDSDADGVSDRVEKLAGTDPAIDEGRRDRAGEADAVTGLLVGTPTPRAW